MELTEKQRRRLKALVIHADEQVGLVQRATSAVSALQRQRSDLRKRLSEVESRLQYNRDPDFTARYAAQRDEFQGQLDALERDLSGAEGRQQALQSEAEPLQSLLMRIFDEHLDRPAITVEERLQVLRAGNLKC
jgi:predicted  nucleic acid-binding Zn-ribbon protein